MDKILQYGQYGSDEKLVNLRIGNYRDSNAIYAVLISAEHKDTGRPFRGITTRPDDDVPAYHAAIKTTEKDLVEMLIQQGLGHPTNDIAHAGFASLFIFEFDKDELYEYDPKGMEDYTRHIAARKDGVE